MSELINKNDNRATIRWKLLTGASALALTAYIAPPANAEDASQPLVWIELGGQLNEQDINSQLLAPDFLSMRPSNFSSPLNLEKPPRFGLDEDGTLSFQPHGSDWVFSASIRYGRSSKSRHVHQQSYPLPQTYIGTLEFGTADVRYPRAERFADTIVKNSEKHFIIDFQAGKDVGLGLFGGKVSSTVSLGVRFAHFNDRSRISLKSDPDWHFQLVTRVHSGYHYQSMIQPYHYNSAHLDAARSFSGVGPKLSWNSSVPIAGNAHSDELDFDWGIDAALLFGRQKTRVRSDTKVQYDDNNGGLGFRYAYNKGLPPYGVLATVYNHPVSGTRSRNVTVPNVGGSLGISWKYDDAKVSFGYRADVFFNAIDGGIAARKSENRAFYGPYASISIGLGD